MTEATCENCGRRTGRNRCEMTDQINWNSTMTLDDGRCDHWKPMPLDMFRLDDILVEPYDFETNKKPMTAREWLKVVV